MVIHKHVNAMILHHVKDIGQILAMVFWNFC